MRLIENMYSTLMRYKKTYGEVEPDLAASYEVSPDQKRYTFHLRHGVRFHTSGRELEAADVKFSIERIRKKQIRADQFSAGEAHRDARSLYGGARAVRALCAAAWCTLRTR